MKCNKIKNNSVYLSVINSNSVCVCIYVYIHTHTRVYKMFIGLGR